MEITRINELKQIASEVRKDIVRMVGVARSGPLDFPLLISDILVYLYWEEMLLLAESPRRNDRDRFFLGTEEGVPALYSVLAKRGYFDREELWHYRRLGAILQALPDFRRTPGIDAPCVTSGTELSIAAGFAESLGREKNNVRIFCLLEEKECTSVDFLLEAARCGKRNISNIIVIIVCKNIEASNVPDIHTSCRESLYEYGWRVFDMEGCDFASMEKIFNCLNSGPAQPAAVFASMRNGRGISFVDAGAGGAKKTLSTEAMDRVLEELEGRSNG